MTLPLTSHEDILNLSIANSTFKFQLNHIIDIMVGCGVAEIVPLDNIRHWSYLPTQQEIIVEKEYKDVYDPFGDCFETYLIHVDWLKMSDDDLHELFQQVYEQQQEAEKAKALTQLQRDAKEHGYYLVLRAPDGGHSDE